MEPERKQAGRTPSKERAAVVSEVVAMVATMVVSMVAVEAVSVEAVSVEEWVQRLREGWQFVCRQR